MKADDDDAAVREAEEIVHVEGIAELLQRHQDGIREARRDEQERRR